MEPCGTPVTICNVLDQGPANFLGRGPKCKVLSSCGPNLASTDTQYNNYIIIYMYIQYTCIYIYTNISFIVWVMRRLAGKHCRYGIETC